MITIQNQYTKKDYNIKTNWNEITLKEYLSIQGLIDKTINKQLTLPEFYMEVADIVSGEDIQNELPFQENFQSIVTALQFLLVPAVPEDCSSFEINGITYAFPQNVKQITSKEWFAIDNDMPEKPTDAILPILSVILRPATKEINEETKETYYKQIKFDGTNIPDRKNLFLSLPVVKLLGPITFFLTGVESYLPNSGIYTAEKTLETKIESK